GNIADETAAKILMDGKLSFPAADVRDVHYIGRLGLDKRNGYGNAIKAEEAIDKAGAGGPKIARNHAATPGYDTATADVKGIEPAKRHFEYKIASLTGRLANEDPTQRKAAVDLLLKFKKDHANSWQITRAVQRLADLQMANDDYKGAMATLKEMQDMK